MALTIVQLTEEFKAHVAARNTVSPALDANSTVLFSGRVASRVRTSIAYGGAVTAAAVRLWIYNARTAKWARGASTADLDPLVPTTDGADARDWDIGYDQLFAFTLDSIAPSGGVPTVAIDVSGVDFQGGSR
jgi:transposase